MFLLASEALERVSFLLMPFLLRNTVSFLLNHVLLNQDASGRSAIVIAVEKNNRLHHQDDFSELALQHGGLNSLSQV